MEVNVGAEIFLFCPKLGSLRLSALLFPVLPALFALADVVSLLPVK